MPDVAASTRSSAARFDAAGSVAELPSSDAAVPDARIRGIDSATSPVAAAPVDPGAATDAPLVEVTPRARDLLKAITRRDGLQAVVLSWPSGATYLPDEYYAPTWHDMVLGLVGGCPVYADVRRLALFRERRILVDVDSSASVRRRPVLRVRSTERECPV